MSNGLYRWAGLSAGQANLFSGLSSLLFMGTIEIFDGYSEKWGFSWGDMGANLVGIGLATGQFAAWNDQRIQLQFSYHPTAFRVQRPDELGSNGIQGILKDYNGQSYWASINLASFLKSTTWVPTWANIAIGIGANGMLSGRINPENPESIHRNRYLFLSLDAKLNNLLAASSVEQTTATALSFLKIPAPTLRLNTSDHTIRFYPIYY